MKPIETLYNGYNFRSRLEARWAVFFDTLGIKYEYEHEGYDLGDAGWYLPDFWLPTVRRPYASGMRGILAEVKGTACTEVELKKCKKLVEFTDAPLILLVGVPEFPDKHCSKPYGFFSRIQAACWEVLTGLDGSPALDMTLDLLCSDQKAISRAVVSARSVRFGRV